MAFDFDDLFEDESFAAEFRPTKKVRKGFGLQLDLNRQLVTIEFLEKNKRNIEGILDLDKRIALMKDDESEEIPSEKPAEPADDNSEAKPEQSIEEIKTDLGEQLEVFNSMTNEIKMMATVLGGSPGESTPSSRVIRAWNLARKGKDVPVSYEELVNWEYVLLKRLYNFCVYEAAKPEKKKGKQSGNT